MEKLVKTLGRAMSNIQQSWGDYKAFQIALAHGHQVAVHKTGKDEEDIECIMELEGYYLCPVCMRYYTDIHDPDGNVIGCEGCQVRAVLRQKRCIECSRKFTPGEVASRDPFCCAACEAGY